MDILNRWTHAVIKSIAGDSLSEADLREANLSEASCLTAFMPGVLRLAGSRHAVICVDADNLSIGCIRESLAWWQEHARAVGRKEQCTDSEIAEYVAHINYAKQWLNARNQEVLHG